MGLTRASWYKRSATGARRVVPAKKRAHQLGRQSANTRLGPKRIHAVRVRGGNLKQRALRLEAGNFAWGSEHITAKTRILGVVFNASNNELVRTNTLVKNAIVQVDAAPFRQAYEKHYGLPVTVKKGLETAEEEGKRVGKFRRSWKNGRRRLRSVRCLSNSLERVGCMLRSRLGRDRVVVRMDIFWKEMSWSTTFVGCARRRTSTLKQQFGVLDWEGRGAVSKNLCGSHVYAHGYMLGSPYALVSDSQ